MMMMKNLLITLASSTSLVFVFSASTRSSIPFAFAENNRKQQEYYRNGGGPKKKNVVKPASTTPPSSSSATTYRSLQQQGEDDDYDDSSHRPCGSVLGNVSIDEMTRLADFYLPVLLREDESNLLLLPAAREMLLEHLRYNVTAVKVCQSCADHPDLYSNLDFMKDTDDATFGAYLTYCNPDGSTFGYDSIQSALVFYPVDNTTGTILAGRPRTLIHMPMQANLTVESAPSVFWPSDLSDAMPPADDTPPDDFLRTYVDYVPGLLAASSGAVTIIPDTIGYGRSQRGYNRTNSFHPQSYMQAAVLSCLAALETGKQMSNNCTVLDFVTTMSGSGPGGGAAVFAATAAMERMNVRVLKVFSGQGHLNPQVQQAFQIDSLMNNLVNSSSAGNAMFTWQVPFAAFAGSIDTPGLANTGSSQSFLSPNSSGTTVTEWFSNPDPLAVDAIAAQLPNNTATLAVLHPAYLDMFQRALAVGASMPCENATLVAEGETDKLCQVLQDATMWDYVASTTIETDLCWSDDDTATSPQNVPQVLLDNPVVNRFTNVAEMIHVRGDYWNAAMVCMNNPILFFGLNAGAADAPNFVAPLTETQQARCTPPVNPDDDATTSAATTTAGFGYESVLLFGLTMGTTHAWLQLR